MPDHPFVRGRRHIMRKEPAFKELLKRVGPCTLQPDPDGFRVLACSIISQQISGKAARSISGRLIAKCGRTGLKPAKLAKFTDVEIRECGISANKVLSLRSLTQHFLEDKALRGNLDHLSDEEIHDHLIPIRGIGTWTAQMFLIFSLGRLDVLPVADLGVRSGAQTVFGLEEMPKAAELTALAEPWRPYRTIASWYLWRSKDAT